MEPQALPFAADLWHERRGMDVATHLDTRRDEAIGLVCAALCALGGAFVPAVAKITADALPPPLVAAATSAFAGAAALAVLAARGALRSLFDRRHVAGLAFLGFLGTAVTFWLFYAGARRATAIETALCLQIEPFYALLGAWLVLGQRPTRGRLVAIAAVLAGVALAIGAHDLHGSIGVWLLLATPLCWQASHLFVARRLQGVPPGTLTAARYFWGAFYLAPAAALAVERSPSAADLLRLVPALAVQGVLLSYAGTLAWYSALARLDLARTTAIVVPSIPILSLGASFVLLGEVATLRQWIGLLLVVAGVVGFALARPPVPAGAEVVPPLVAE